MSKQFSASLDGLYDMLAYIRQRVEHVGFDESQVLKIELACEEALVNIISYGYPMSQGYIEIDFQKPENALGITIIVRDQGLPYNPLSNAKQYDPSAPLEARVLGGCGVFFILKLMDEVAYSRKQNNNILMLTKLI